MGGAVDGTGSTGARAARRSSGAGYAALGLYALALPAAGRLAAAAVFPRALVDAVERRAGRLEAVMHAGRANQEFKTRTPPLGGYL